jgi:hypothetical protein
MLMDLLFSFTRLAGYKKRIEILPAIARVNRLTVFYREYTVNPGIRP